MKRKPTIILAGILALMIIGLMVAIIVPSLPRYNFASIIEARSFGQMEDVEIVDELGDTNGPYRLRGGVAGGRMSTQFSFNLTFEGHTTNWSQPASSNTGFVVTIFENRRGNQFAIVRKTKQ